jgi:hypothetical protein
MAFGVGKILYLLSNKNLKIVAARVEAVTTVESVAGSKTTHQVSVLGYDDNIVLEALDVKPFLDVVTLKDHLVKVISDKVNSEVADVVSLASAEWNLTDVNKDTSTIDEIIDSSDDDTIHVELGDGMRARVHIPKELL